MKILFVGGSNTLMTNGYAQSLSDALLKRYPGADILNIAIGANSCVHGLELCAGRDDLHTYDLIFVEYLVNDYKLSSPKYVETWKRSYEGIIRRIVKSNGKAHIVSILLGHKSEKYFEQQESLRKEIKAISDYYSIHVIDADAYLKSVVGGDAAAFGALYKDEGHIRVPLVTEIVSNYAMKQLDEILAAPPVKNLGLKTLYPNGFDNMSILSAHEKSDDETRHIFANSKVHCTTYRLAQGKTLEFELQSDLIGVSYLSTKDSGPLLIEEEGYKSMLIYTCHQSADRGKLRFLLKAFPVPHKRWVTPSKGGKLRLTCLTPEEAKQWEPNLQKDYAMGISTSWDKEYNVYLNNIVCG